MSEELEDRARRRGRRSSRGQGKGLKSRGFGRIVLVTVAAVGVLCFVYQTHKLRVSALMYGALMTDMPEHEVRYLQGPPEQQSPDGLSWTYGQAGATQTFVRYDSGGRVRSIACTGPLGGAATCPAVLGVNLGDSEDRLVNRLGPGTGSLYIPNGKILRYADLGLEFTLRRYQVAGITKVRRSGRVGYLPRVAWTLLP